MQLQILTSCPLRVGTCDLEDRGFVVVGPRFSLSQLRSNRPNTRPSLLTAECAYSAFSSDDRMARS
jgi:hypothetical protein